MRRKNIFHLVALSALIFGRSHLIAITHSVAVMPFENTTKDSSLDWLSMGIPETITNDLLAIKGLVLVERVQLRKVMDEQKLQLTGAIDEQTVVQVGKLIGASVLVVGAFQKQAGTVRLTARFVDVETGGILQTAKVTGNMNEIFDLQDKIVKDLARNLNIELKQEELAKIALKPTDSLEAYQHFGEGILLQSRRDYQGAIKELEKSIKADPKFAVAKEKFKEMFWSLKQGNYWTYEVTTTMQNKAELKSLQTRRAGGLEEIDGTPVFSYLHDTITENMRMTVTQYFYKGDDGIYNFGMKIGFGQSNVNSFAIYESPFFYSPYDLIVGMKWPYKSAYKIKLKLNAKMSEGTPGETNGNSEVIAVGTITVPAGTFNCFVIESKSTEKMGSNESELNGKVWFAPGIGIIKILIQESFSGYPRTVTSILKEYHIAE